MEQYWIDRQNRLLQKHHDVFPNEKEFWFSNIVDELNRYQNIINSIRKRN